MKDIHTKKLTVVINNNPILEFDRGKPLPGHQRQYLDNMDTRMDQGILLGEAPIDKPNALERAQFVANSMVNALLEEKDALAAAMCTYLAKRMPDLQQVKASHDAEKGLSIELVFDRSFEKAQQEQVIEFKP